MKNITVSVDDTTYRRARIKAAEQDTSVSALVRGFLQGITAEESPFDQLRREELDLRAGITRFSGAERLSRDDVHERKS